MEPPGEGRYEQRLRYQPGRGVGAAMEPPGEGRYEHADALYELAEAQPQWSRPVKGGTSTSSATSHPLRVTCRNGAAR